MELLLQMLRRAEAERDEAIAARARAWGAEQTALAQRQQLCAYRDDYEQRWHGHFRAGGTMTTLVANPSFNGRLTQALEQQQRTLEHLRALRERADAALLERERKVASTAKLIERRLSDGRRAAARREAKLEDECAARAAATHAARMPPGETQ
jgi:flagellar FliJ protein